jgi:hypothetical protein
MRKLTSLLKNRWLSFMTTNGSLDTSVQEAFIPGMPGCPEQYQKLSAAITEVNKKHALTNSMLAIAANAYGSVHQSLIRFALEHYHGLP